MCECCEADSLRGFVQRIVNLAGNGYYFARCAKLDFDYDPRKLDAKMHEKYDLHLSRGQLYRHKQAGRINVAYTRWERFYVLQCTHGTGKGRHRFYPLEEEQPKHLRKRPVRLAGYSISMRQSPETGRWEVPVRLDKEQEKIIKATFLEMATKRSGPDIALQMYTLDVDAYGEVQRQLGRILEQVNRRRKMMGYEPVPFSCIRRRRRVPKQLRVPRPSAG